MAEEKYWLPTIGSVRKFKAAMDSEFGALGPFMITIDPAMYEACGLAGYDFALIDMEHGITSFTNLVDMVRGCNCVDVCPVVRIPRGTDIWISRALDCGAGAIFVPQVETPEEAARIVDAAKFSPMGHRGLSKYVRAGGYNACDEKHFYEDGNETAVILQCEGPNAVANLEKILDVPGIDVIFIGPYDLSSSLGLIGQVTHPKVVEKIKEVIAICAKKGVKVGCFADTVERGIELREMGVKFIGYTSEVKLFLNAATADVAKWHNK